MSTGPAGALTSGVAPPQQQLSATPPSGVTTEQAPPIAAQPVPQGPVGGTVQRDENGNLIRLFQGGGLDAQNQAGGLGSIIQNTNLGFGGGGSGGPPQVTQGGMFGSGGLLNSQPMRVQPMRVQPDRRRGLIQ